MCISDEFDNIKQEAGRPKGAKDIVPVIQCNENTKIKSDGSKNR